jgi:aspartyl-tRNA(Asn)/glutamyl-tRNA(Gln) amidotransferase subunit A
MTADWLTQSAADLGREIHAGRIDPVALTEAFLDAIATHPDGPRIYACAMPERALTEARASAQRARDGMRRGPLDGVPVSWKDLFDTAGTATESGSELLKGRVPTRDARVLANATAAGLVALGKTHMSELAFSGLGLNPITATPPNVNDPDAVPGGSSSGAAASVAFGLAAAAVGSDTGGSVRIPAAWNDLVGLKPAHGLLSLEGTVPLAPSFDTVGSLCRTVEDSALMLAALGGQPAPDLRGATLRDARLMVLETVALDDLRDGPRQAFEAAIEALARAGAVIERRSIPSVAQAMQLTGILYTTEAYGIWQDDIRARGAVMFPAIRERFESGAGFLGADFVAAWLKLRTLRAEYAAATAGFDAVVLPTGASLPPDAARLMSDNDYYVTENLLALRNTRIGNLMGQAALTLPTSVPSAGVSLMGAPGCEGRLLRLGAAAEHLLREG